MRAVTLPTHGGLEALVVAEVEAPVPQPGEVLLDVVATAVNRADLLQRMGFYDPPAGASPYPGIECSGVVRALGEGVTGWSVGEEVCALLTGGGYAEQVAVPAGQLLPVPEGVSVVDAAALPEAACTVWSNVAQLARLQPGERLLVHGGGSGIGTHAIQVAAALGATVTVAPSALPTWIACVPMPEPPPCTSRCSPARSRASCTTFDQTVQATSGSAAASTTDTPSGTGSSCPAGTATCSAYPPPTSSAHTGSPTDQPSTPSP
jgi:Zn-dependent alcohol dehydrogenase